MRDVSHEDFIHRWAAHVRTNSSWKEEHTQFINAQYQKHQELITRLSQSPQGKEKLKQIFRR